MDTGQKTGIMIPISVSVSRATGKVIRVETIDGTPTEVNEYVKALRKIGRAAQRAAQEAQGE